MQKDNPPAEEDGNLHWLLIPFTWFIPSVVVNNYPRSSLPSLPPGIQQVQR